MTSRERVLAAFEHQSTDKVPIHHIGFSSRVASIILGREAYVGGGIQQWREAKALWEGEEAHREYLERSNQGALDITHAVENDLLRLSYWRMATKPTKKINESTFLYGEPEKNWHVMRFDQDTELYQIIDQYPPKREPTLESIEQSIVASEGSLENYHPKPEDFAGTRTIMETHGGEYAVRIGGGSLAIPNNSQAWLEAVALRPDLVARYLNIQAEQAARSMEGLATTGAKLVFGGGDFASNKGPFYSPKAFHELMLPGLQKIADACHKHGMYYLFASDGNLWPVADDLFGNSGVDGYYEIDRRAGMDLRKLRERYPHLVMIGNISSHTLHRGTKEDVIAEAMSCLEEAKKSGGIIIGISNYALPGTSEENIWAMIETIRENRDFSEVR